MAPRTPAFLVPTVLLLVACSSPAPPGSPASPRAPAGGTTAAPTGDSPDGRPFAVTPVATLDEPWAMAFLPDGRALVTQRGGSLVIVDPADGATTTVAGTPRVVHEGQGGLGDIALTPTHATDQGVYLSWVETGDGGTSGAVVGRARLVAGESPRLAGLTPIWRQDPKTSGSGHFSHRLAVSPDGAHLFVSSGDRQKFDPAQDMSGNLGKIVRLEASGRPAAGNPFADRGGVAAQVWSLGHRNVLGLAFDPAGRLWASEMGPKGGDELNLIEPGKNYGWPQASNGSHYDGRDIPDHRAGDGFAAPKAWWTPSVSPGSLMIYGGDAFPAWKGDAFLGGLSGQALIRVDLDGANAAKAERWDMGERIREVEQGPDGALWLLQDGDRGRLLRLTPAG